MKKVRISLPSSLLFIFLWTSISAIAQPYPKIRIGFEDGSGYHRQMLLTFIPETSLGVDFGYDGALTDVQPNDAFWLIENNEYVIQAIPQPTVSTELPLGINLQASGEAIFMIDALEDMSEPFEVYLKDNMAAQPFDLATGNFQTTLASGAYNSRFSIVVFPSSVLSIEEEAFKGHVRLHWSRSDSRLLVSQRLYDFNRMAVFDICGRKIAVENIDSKDAWIPLSTTKGTYVIQLASNEKTISQKIVIH